MELLKLIVICETGNSSKDTGLDQLEDFVPNSESRWARTCEKRGYDVVYLEVVKFTPTLNLPPINWNLIGMSDMSFKFCIKM